MKTRAMKDHLLLGEKTKEELLELLMTYQRALDYNLITSIADLDGTILCVNKQFCDVSKYSESELLGQNHCIVSSGHHGPAFFKKMWEELKKGGLWHGEIKNSDKRGIPYWVDMIIIPLKNNEGVVFQYLSLQTLITEQKRFEEEKVNMLLETEELLNMTSHRVRGPAATCLGLINLLEFESTRPQSFEETLKCLRHIKNAILELDLFTKEFTKHLTQLHQCKKKLSKSN